VKAHSFRLALLVFLGMPAFASADVMTGAGWDAARTTSPETVEELKALQTQVKTISGKVMPATVGLFVGNGAGSGVIVKDDGLVLTAAHVIGKPGTKLKVVLNDGTFVEGRSLGLNSKIDSGMVQITGKPPADATWPGAAEGKWPTVELGKSSKLLKGQWVIALGHHGGYRRDRTPPLRLGRFEYYNKQEQTLRSDCTLVGGDSGGPLFDLNGKLIGIHSKISFLIDYNHHVAIDAFQTDWDELAMIKKDKIEDMDFKKPSVETTTSKGGVELGATLDKEKSKPTIMEVAADSPAEKAGLLEGDIILRIDGERVKTREELRAALSNYKPGEKITIVVQRGEEMKTVRLTLGMRSAK